MMLSRGITSTIKKITKVLKTVKMPLVVDGSHIGSIEPVVADVLKDFPTLKVCYNSLDNLCLISHDTIVFKSALN